jgi:protein-disulfide isomerase
MTRLHPPLGPGDHVQGPADARITLVEYGDYECPFCGEAHPIMKALQQALGDDLRFAFRHFPLAQAHPHATRAAQAAEAAGLQDSFWEMHDLLFENQDKLDEPYLRLYAQRLGLDLERFDRDIDSEGVMVKVRTDFLSGARSGVNGTPTFFVNGERYDGSWASRDFLAYLAGLLEDDAQSSV